MATFEDVLHGVADVASFRPGEGWCDEVPLRPVVMSGSFRPLHRAHRRLLTIGARYADTDGIRPRAFELSIANVEKPAIAAAEVVDRLAQFRDAGDIVLLTREATFVGKARVLPGASFVIGYDTAIRLFDERFYTDADGVSGAASALRTIRDQGCNFVVGGRHDAHGEFLTWDNFDCPSEFRGMFTTIPESEFSDAISSSQIRDASGM